MTLALNDRVKETTTVTGTGTATLLGATTGFQSFAVIGNANTTYYCIADQGGANWEVGIGTYTASGTTLARTTVLASSNAGSLVVFTTGVKDVFVTYPSEKGVWYDASGNILFTGTATATVGNLLVGTTSASVPSTTGFVSSANTFAYKNRIINGGMVIDQRNTGASVTPTMDATYSVDRFTNRLTQASKYSVQQVIDAPAGLYNSLKFTSLSAYTLTSTDFFGVDQRIEGNNWSDLDWGKATGVSVTLSFWVKSSLTGTFGATILAYSYGYPSYPFSYTITNANTWQQIVITIPAPPVTSGWGVGSAGCILMEWSLGTGLTLKGTANTWNTTTIYRAATTENVSFVSNNAATWQITGVQLEKGSAATSFDYRPYGTELSLCQRYLPCWNATSATSMISSGYVASATFAYPVVVFPVQTRIAPTGLTVSNVIDFAIEGTITITTSSVSLNNASNYSARVQCGVVGATANGGVSFRFNSATGQLLFTGCEL